MLGVVLVLKFGGKVGKLSVVWGGDVPGGVVTPESGGKVGSTARGSVGSTGGRLIGGSVGSTAVCGGNVG